MISRENVVVPGFVAGVRTGVDSATTGVLVKVPYVLVSGGLQIMQRGSAIWLKLTSVIRSFRIAVPLERFSETALTPASSSGNHLSTVVTPAHGHSKGRLPSQGLFSNTLGKPSLQIPEIGAPPETYPQASKSGELITPSAVWFNPAT